MNHDQPFPSIFIIGAQRCATSTLYGHLSQHPEIFMSKLKEPRYFSHILKAPDFKGPGDDERVNKATITDRERYLQLFKDAQPHQMCGEATTTYLGDPQALMQIARTVKHPKIIIILRNPLERAYSSYCYKRNEGLEPADSFEKAIKDESRRIKENWAPIWHYTARSKYLESTKQALSTFGEQNVKIIRYDSFVSGPERELSQLVDFLSLKYPFPTSLSIHYNDSASLIPQSRFTQSFKRFRSGVLRLMNGASNASTKKTCSTDDIAKETVTRLQVEFREDILALEKLLDWDLSNWISR